MNKVFSVIDYGAVPDLSDIQTQAFQNALDQCYISGGGTVIVPNGKYIIGDIRIRSNTTLLLSKNTIIEGSKNPEDYMNIYKDNLEPLPEEQATKALWKTPQKWQELGGGFKPHLYTAGSYWNYGLIRAVYAENIEIRGEEGSLIDGTNVFDPQGEEDYRGPHGINIHFCKNIKFSGYTIQNTGNWSHAIFQCENVSFSNLTVLGGHDALHTRACSNVRINDCNLVTGDDCIAGFDNLDVVIRNCKISSSCSAFRFGGNNILIENCDISAPCKYQFRGSFSYEEKKSGALFSEKGRNNMLSFFTFFVTDDLPQRKEPGNIIIKNCNITGADRLLHINLSGNEPWQRGNPPTDITFENITATNIKTGLYAYGKKETPFILNLKDIKYRVADGFENEPFIKTAYFKEINFNNVDISNYKGNSFIRTWSDGGVINTVNLNCKINENELITKSQIPFKCDMI